MTRRPRILFAMITVGEGHRAPADALAQWLDRLAPAAFEHDVLDFTRAVGDVALDAWHKRTWNRMLAAPSSAYLGQRLVDGIVPTRLSRAVQAWILRDHARHAAAFLRERPYDLIVATHFFTAHALGIARRRHGLTTPVHVVSPDARDAHALWAEPTVERFYVPSEPARTDLVRRGIDPRRVEVTPPVLRPAFGSPCAHADRTAARRERGLPEDAFVVLWAPGGEGIGSRIERVLDALERRGTDVHVLALCGRNDELRTGLDRRTGADRHVRVHPLPFQHDVRSLLCASDVFVGKAGPSSTFEALVSGVPVLHDGYAAANEKALSDWLVGTGAGLRVRAPERIAATLADLRARPERLAELKDRVHALGTENGGATVALRIAERARQAAGTAEPVP